METDKNRNRWLIAKTVDWQRDSRQHSALAKDTSLDCVHWKGHAHYEVLHELISCSYKCVYIYTYISVRTDMSIFQLAVHHIVFIMLWPYPETCLNSDWCYHLVSVPHSYEVPCPSNREKSDPSVIISTLNAKAWRNISHPKPNIHFFASLLNII